MTRFAAGAGWPCGPARQPQWKNPEPRQNDGWVVKSTSTEYERGTRRFNNEVSSGRLMSCSDARSPIGLFGLPGRRREPLSSRLPAT